MVAMTMGLVPVLWTRKAPRAVRPVATDGRFQLHGHLHLVHLRDVFWRTRVLPPRPALWVTEGTDNKLHGVTEPTVQ